MGGSLEFSIFFLNCTKILLEISIFFVQETFFTLPHRFPNRESYGDRRLDVYGELVITEIRKSSI